MEPDYYSQKAAALLQAVLNPGQDLRLRVNGKSMAPLLLPGDMLFVQAVPVNKLNSGDVIVMQDADGLLTHRLIAIRGEQLLTKGDALTLPDPPLPLAALIGRVQTVERDGKICWDFTHSAWQNGQAWLARCSGLEGQIMAQAYHPAHPATKLQKCIARCVSLPFRWLGFLLQWVIRQS